MPPLQAEVDDTLGVFGQLLGHLRLAQAPAPLVILASLMAPQGLPLQELQPLLFSRASVAWV